MTSYDSATLASWTDALQTAYPYLPKGVIDQAIMHYTINPEAFDEVCEAHKANPEGFEPKKRDTKAVYDTTESGNELPWGEIPIENNISNDNNDATEKNTSCSKESCTKESCTSCAF
jgi:hypothetical protein